MFQEEVVNLFISSNNSNLLGFLLTHHDGNLLSEGRDQYRVRFECWEFGQVFLDVFDFVENCAAQAVLQISIFFAVCLDFQHSSHQRLSHEDPLKVWLR